MSGYCRGCFAFIDAATIEEHHNLSEDVPDLKLTLAEIFYNCVGFEIGLNNGTMVCNDCYGKLIKFCLFQRQVCETEEKFREMQGELELDIKIEPESEVVEQEEEPPENDLEDAIRLWNESPMLEADMTFNDWKFRCPQCPGRKFATAANLKNHNSQLHLPRLFTCDICDKRYTSHKCIRDHIHRYHLKQVHVLTCSECGKTFANASILTRHMRIVHCDIRRYVCSLCGTRRKTSNALKMHMETHQTALEYACLYCTKKFNREFNLKLHIKAMHINPPSLNHACTLCPRTFKRRMNLLDHLQTHSDATPFQCHECPNAYKTKLALYNHVKTKHDPGVKYKFKTLENATIVMDCNSSVGQSVGLQ